MDVPTHHIVYGTLIDFITGEELPDTDDERTRQDLSKMMVNDLGYQKPKQQQSKQCHLVGTIFFQIHRHSAINTNRP